jgi:hypothetical protein
MSDLRRTALAGLSAAALLCAPLLAGSEPAPTVGRNTVSGKVQGGACGLGVVYLYPYIPDISGADGNVKAPLFETPAVGDEHWEARCVGGAFTFTQIPDGTYLAGLPGANPADRALIASVTVEGGQSMEVLLKPQTNAD